LNSGFRNTVWIITFCRMEITVEKPETAMNIHARIFTNVDFCGDIVSILFMVVSCEPLRMELTGAAAGGRLAWAPTLQAA
jgi:hypothetical protein